MSPYYEHAGITIYLGDNRDILPTLESGIADMVLTDPPYSSGGFQEAARSGGSVGTRTTETIRFDNLSTRGYERLMREVFRWCNQVDEVYVFTDWRMWVYAFDAMETAGWRVRNMLVWDKMQMGMGMPWRNQHELIAYGKRSPGKIIDGLLGNVLRCPRSGNEYHPTEKPISLLSTIIGNSEAQTILDPFMGSGSTLLAAKLLGRRAIGIEISEAYAEIAAKRLQQEMLPMTAPPVLAEQGVLV